MAFLKGSARMSNDKPILVSYPHSGSNWIRYCIEYFSGLPTPGTKRHPLVSSGEMIIDRTHFLDQRHRRPYMRARQDPSEWDDYAGRKSCPLRLYSGLKREWRVRDIIKNRQVILLLRGPAESYCRNRVRFQDGMIGYLGNIRIFDACQQDKLLVYYEDLVKDFGEMGRILDFLGVSHDLSSFDLDHHRAKSFDLYSTGRYRAQSREDLYNFSFHSGEMSNDLKSALRAFSISFLGPDIYDKYLSRFDVSDESAPLADRISTPVAQRDFGS
jgi:hypothetical protein